MGLLDPHSMWDLPRPGIKHMFPALAGRLLTIGPPGKSPNWYFYSLLDGSNEQPGQGSLNLVWEPWAPPGGQFKMADDS